MGGYFDKFFIYFYFRVTCAMLFTGLWVKDLHFIARERSKGGRQANS